MPVTEAPTFAQKAIAYFTHLEAPLSLPPSVEVMNPYEKAQVQQYVQSFYTKFYNDGGIRTFVLGINPGRFGGGTTGISFTDPVVLATHCGIPHTLPLQQELSSKFVYACIASFGGVEAFFSSFFLSALYPLALTRHGKNYNYYDEAALYTHLKPAIVTSLQTHMAFGANPDYAICLGRKNFNYLNKLNDEYHFFKEIVVLDHPRYIMQYKTKQMHAYIDQYVEAFKKTNP